MQRGTTFFGLRSNLLQSRCLSTLGLAALAIALCCRGSEAQVSSVPVQDGSPTSESNTEQAAVSPLDHSVFTPEASGALGQVDATAVAELTASSAALVGSNSHWVGMQGTGTITYATDSNQYSVTLSNFGVDRFRLDTQMPAGLESIRIEGRAGKMQVGDGPIQGIDPDTAIMGIFPFEIVEKAAVPGKNVALLDRGTVSTGGQSLHRITLELPSILRNAATRSQKLLPVDLYFDPSTHLLVKSVGYILIPGARRVPFLSVVTYSDYRSIGTSLIPFRCVETLNGQPYRTLQLTSVQTNLDLSTAYFQF